MDIKELCFSLAFSDGTPGDELAASALAEKLLSDFAETKIDTMQNVIGTMGSGEKTVLLDAHIDRIGLAVRGVDDGGFLLIDSLGGVDERVLTGAQVTVFAKETLSGVICSVPPHLSSKDDEDSAVSVKRLAVDVGLTKEQAQKLVYPGDRIVFRSVQRELLSNRIVSPALDDRCGVAVLIKTAELLCGKLHNTKVVFLFSAQEETGESGAETGAFSVCPDMAIAVDVGFGNDSYTDKFDTIELGKGPSIGISPVLDRTMVKELVSVAQKNSISFQHDVMGGRTGTNADKISISRGGVRTALLSVPLRNMHTAVEVVDLGDLEETARLIAAYILEKDGELSC